MKPAERDELLGRLDERSINTYHLVEKLERHQRESNGIVISQGERIAKNETKIRLIWKIGLGILGSGSVGVGISQLLVC